MKPRKLFWIVSAIVLVLAVTICVYAAYLYATAFANVLQHSTQGSMVVCKSSHIASYANYSSEYANGYMDMDLYHAGKLLEFHYINIVINPSSTITIGWTSSGIDHVFYVYHSASADTYCSLSNSYDYASDYDYHNWYKESD
jgi:hypothetical protein